MSRLASNGSKLAVPFVQSGVLWHVSLDSHWEKHTSTHSEHLQPEFMTSKELKKVAARSEQVLTTVNMEELECHHRNSTGIEIKPI